MHLPKLDDYQAQGEQEKGDLFLQATDRVILAPKEVNYLHFAVLGNGRAVRARDTYYIKRT